MYKIISILLFLTLSCQQKNEVSETSQELLSHDKMVHIIKDIRLADSNAKLLKINRDSMNLMLEQHYDTIFQLHSVEKKVFVDSYTYYMEKPEQLNLIFEKVIEELLKLDIQYNN
tara:strand:+ start:95 stop:439 length:345 start_codon:yes stop_codon:yes gene_type:complete